MAHSLHRFTHSLLKEPQLITQDRFEFIVDYLQSRDAVDYVNRSPKLFSVNTDNNDSSDSNILVENGVGTLYVEGDITSSRTGWESLCGGCNYPDLISRTETLISQGAKFIHMQVDSGGGSAHKAMESARLIRSKCDEAGVKLIAYVDGSSGSAAYVLSSVAHEVIANPTSSVGSIGCVIALTDRSKQMEMDGIKPIFITSTEGKAPYNEDGSFREEFLGDLKDDVDALHNDFVEHVNNYRGIPAEKINAMKSKMYRAPLALEQGLIDKVMEVEEFCNYLADMSGGEQTNSPQQTGSSPTKIAAESNVAETQLTNIGDEEMTPEQQAKLEQFDAMQAKLAELEAAQTQAKATEIKESLSAYTFLSDDVQASLSEVLLAEGEQATLLNTVLTQANDGIKAAVDSVKAESQEVIETLSSEVEEAKAEVESTKSEMNAIKEQFGDQASIQGEVDKQELSAPKDRAAQLAEFAAKRKAELLAK